MSEQDPLQELLVDGRDLDRARIAGALRGRLAIDDTTGQAVVQSGFADLSSRQKLLAFLLLRKVGLLLERIETDAITPSALSEQTGIPPGSVRRGLLELVDAHAASRRAGGVYCLSNPQVGPAVEALAQVGPPDALNPSGRSPAESTRSRTARKAAGPGRGKKPPAKVNKSNQRSRRSPTALVEELRQAGFLDKPKTLAEMQSRLRDKTGHQIPVTTLSPILTRMLRAATLDRERTADGKYAYVKRS